jgi:predicted solute-binding protein
LLHIKVPEEDNRCIKLGEVHVGQISAVFFCRMVVEFENIPTKMWLKMVIYTGLEDIVSKL